MNKYQIMLYSSYCAIASGAMFGAVGLLKGSVMVYIGALLLITGLTLLGSWLSKAYIYICSACYLRIETGVKEALFALPSGHSCRRLYCSKCRRKTSCKARRLSMKVHLY